MVGAPSNAAGDVGAQAQLENLLGAVSAFREDHQRYPAEPLVQALGAEMGPLLAEAVARALRRLLQELERSPQDREAQWMGLYLLRRFWHSGPSIRGVLGAHKDAVLQVLGRGVREHQTDACLQSEAMWLLFEIGGLAALLEIMLVFGQSSSVIRPCLRQIKERCQDKAVWWEWLQQPWERTLQPLLVAMETHPHDNEFLGEALWFLQDFLWDPSFRDAFGSRGGWPVVVGTMKANPSHRDVQFAGCRAIVGLGTRGGSWGVQWEEQAAAAVCSAVQAHSQDAELLRWAFWALKEVNGVGALLQLLHQDARSMDLKLATAIFSSLSELPWGQADSLDAAAACQVVERATVWLRQVMPWSHVSLTIAAQKALGRAARHVAPLQQPGGSPAASQCAEAVGVATDTLLWLLRECLADAPIAQDACKRIGDLYRQSPPAEPARARIRQLLMDSGAGGASPGATVLRKLASAHVSNWDLQATVMWVMGTVYGPRPVLEEMALNPTSPLIQMHGVRSLGVLYDVDLEDTPEEASEARLDAFSAVVHAMANFPDDMNLCQHSCFTISALAAPPAGAALLGDPALARLCLGGVLRVVRQDRCGYPQKEACRAIVSLAPSLVSLSANNASILEGAGVKEVLENAVWQRVRWAPWSRQASDGYGAAEHEEGLCLCLIALGLVVGLEPVTGTLGRGIDDGKPSVVKAAAEALVELVRLGAGQALSSHVAKLSGLVQSALSAHWDTEVQRPLQLVAGFCSAAATETAMAAGAAEAGRAEAPA